MSGQHVVDFIRSCWRKNFWRITKRANSVNYSDFYKDCQFVLQNRQDPSYFVQALKETVSPEMLPDRRTGIQIRPKLRDGKLFHIFLCLRRKSMILKIYSPKVKMTLFRTRMLRMFYVKHPVGPVFYIPCGNVNKFLISSSVHGHDLFQVRYINTKIDKDMDMGTNTNMNGTWTFTKNVDIWCSRAGCLNSLLQVCTECSQTGHKLSEVLRRLRTDVQYASPGCKAPCQCKISLYSYFLYINFKKSHCCNRRRKILNKLPSLSLGLISMPGGQVWTHFWWHCLFKWLLLASEN